MRLLLICSFFLTYHLFAQEETFKWCTGVQDVSFEYTDLKACPSGGYVAVVEKTQLSYMIRAEPQFMQGDGTVYEGDPYSPYGNDLVRNNGGSAIIHLTEEGKIDWLHIFRKDLVNVRKVAVHPKGDLLFLMNVDEYEEDENGNLYGYLPNFHEDSLLTAGLQLVKLDENGNHIKTTSIQPFATEVDWDELSMTYYADDQLLVKGFADPGKLTNNLPHNVLSGGGDFIMLMDNTGNPIWADVVSYRKKSCCSRAGEGNFFSSSISGMVYLSGSYMTGGVFSNGIQEMAPTTYAKSSSTSSEGYITAYDPKGKLKWVKTVGSQSRVQGIAATKNGVFVSCRVNGIHLFGEKIDTTRVYQNTLAFIDQSGKVKWVKTLPIDRVSRMEVDQDNQLILCGKYKRNPVRDSTVRFLEKYELPRKHELFMVNISEKGKFKSLWSTSLLMSSQIAPIYITSNQKGEVVMAVETFCSFSVPLNKFDQSFPAIKCNGSTAILGKIKN